MSMSDTTSTEQTMTNPLIDLTGFQRDLLRAIADLEGDKGEPSGQDVKIRVEKYGYGEINHGRLYPNLDTLVNKDLVEKGQLDLRTNSYPLSSKGEEKFEEYREFVGE